MIQQRCLIHGRKRHELFCARKRVCSQRFSHGLHRLGKSLRSNCKDMGIPLTSSESCASNTWRTIPPRFWPIWGSSKPMSSDIAWEEVWLYIWRYGILAWCVNSRSPRHATTLMDIIRRFERASSMLHLRGFHLPGMRCLVSRSTNVSHQTRKAGPR